MTTTPTTPAASPRPTGPQISGYAAREDEIRRARTALIAPTLALIIPLAVLLIAIALRFETFAARLVDLPWGFSWLFALFVVAVLGALVAWSVHRAARGTYFGDQWQAAQEIVAESFEIDEELHQESVETDAASKSKIAIGDSDLLAARKAMLAPIMSVELGRYNAAAVLGVAVPALDYRRIIGRQVTVAASPETGEPADEVAIGQALERVLFEEPSPWPEYTRIVKLRATVNTERTEIAAECAKSALSEVTPAPEPFEVFADPAPRPSDVTLHGSNSNSNLLTNTPLFPPIDEPPRKPRRLRQFLLITAACLLALLVGILVWITFSPDASANETGATATATTPVATSAAASTVVSSPAPSTPADPITTAPSPAALVPAAPVLPAGLQEGVDFAYTATTPIGPVRWACTTPIPIRVAGPLDDATRQVVQSATQKLAAATGLPLISGTDLPESITDPGDVPAGEITISYVTPEQVSTHNIDMGPDTLGLGGPRYNDSTITSGWVVIRTSDRVDTASPAGEEVALHELAHAVGLVHSAPGSHEIMKPAIDPDNIKTTWGAGDTYALQSVGCTNYA